MKRSEVQSISFKNGLDASESFLEASPILSPEGTVADAPAEATWFFFTTSLKVKNAEYAASASAPFTNDFRYAGTPGSVTEETELYTSITVDSGTEAITRPSAAFTASQSAFDVTPFAPLALPMALWWASAAAFRSFGSAWAPITIILSMAFNASSGWNFP